MASQEQAVWSVIAMAKEHPDVIRRFVSWHLALGASQITILFDDPADPCIELVSHLPQVKAIACTDAFWATLGETPDGRFTRRQNKACKSAYLQVPDGWVLNMDADELIYAPFESIGRKLARQGPDIRAVLVQPAERVFVNGDADWPVFRMPMNRDQVHDIYTPEIAPLLVRNKGMVGHSAGKSVLRAGMKKFRMRQHYAQETGKKPIVDATLGPTDGIVLLHFFDQGYDDWRRKLEYRLVRKGFRIRLRNLLAEPLAAGDEGKLKAIYADMHHVTEPQLERLRAHGLVAIPDLDLPRVIACYFPQEQR